MKHFKIFALVPPLIKETSLYDEGGHLILNQYSEFSDAEAAANRVKKMTLKLAIEPETYDDFPDINDPINLVILPIYSPDKSD